VEIHQNSATSSDLAFDLAVEGQGFQGPPPAALAPPPDYQAGQLRLLWPAAMHGWELYSSPTLGPQAVWQPVAEPLALTNGYYLFRAAPTGAARYFRLEQR
jgi:hypothetical protein